MQNMKAHTTCVSPPELEDIQLLAHLDGRADREVEAHLEQCPYCRQRASDLAGFQTHMTARLYRLTCPSPSELGEYHLGMLPDTRREAVQHHLDTCPRCFSEVAQLKSYLSELTSDLEFSPLEKAKVLIAQLVGDIRPGDFLAPFALTPVAAGLRGEQAGPRLYQAEGVQIAIETQPDPQAPGSQVLLGLVTGAEAIGWKAHLWQNNQLVTTTSVDNLGNIVISGLAPGQYELILTGPAVEIHIQALEI